MSPEELDLEILECHSRGDAYRLSELYKLASDIKRSSGDFEAAGFLLTQAYVFALESNHADADEMRLQLAQDGRELNK